VSNEIRILMDRQGTYPGAICRGTGIEVAPHDMNFLNPVMQQSGSGNLSYEGNGQVPLDQGRGSPS
jgi:hypothetical protein